MELLAIRIFTLLGNDKLFPKVIVAIYTLASSVGKLEFSDILIVVYLDGKKLYHNMILMCIPLFL